MSEVGEEAIEGNGSLASLASDEQARFFVMPALLKRKNSNEEIFYTSDIEQIAKMEKLQKEYLDKLGRGTACHVHALVFIYFFGGPLIKKPSHKFPKRAMGEMQDSVVYA